ncbi:MAG TPA: hypothetical protein DCS43_02500 [Verrucomicrobia bacterium]|nr:hypothetical protein [Verrucomicrobiota bacterium]
MRMVACAALEPGAILAESVKDAGGKLLIAAGTELTPRHLRALQMWGLREVNIVGHQADAGEGALPAFTAAELAAATVQAEQIFSVCGYDHPLLAVLFSACVQRIAGGKWKPSGGAS